MKLAQYISHLLYRYQCVTVPEFGSFLTETHSARLHPSSRTFYPPKKTVSFNALLKKNDGLLVHHISQYMQTPYDDAVRLVQEEVSLWKKTLNEDNFLELKNIGEIRLNAENNLVFTVTENTNYLTESFGLAPVVSPAIRRSPVIEATQNAEETTEAELETAPIQLTPTKKPSYPFVRYAVAAALLIAGGLFADNLYKNHVTEETRLVEHSVQEKIQQRIQEATFVIDLPKSEPLTLIIKEEKLYYHVIAGAYRDEANAEKEVVNLKEQGYKARVLDKNRFGLYPVVYQSYKTYEEAQEKSREIRKTNPEAWLLFQEI
jgi:hypothetical protein